MAFVCSQRYAHARQINLANAQTRKLRTYLGRIIRDIERKILKKLRLFCALCGFTVRELLQLPLPLANRPAIPAIQFL